MAIPPKLVPEIRFEPRLSGPRAELVKRIPMGAVIKHTAVYERPFWRDDGLSGMVVSDEGPIHVVFDNSLPDGVHGVLMGFSEAKNAQKARHALGVRAPRRRDDMLREALRRASGETDRLCRSRLGARPMVGRLLRRLHATRSLDLGGPIDPRAPRPHPLGRRTKRRWSGAATSTAPSRQGNERQPRSCARSDAAAPSPHHAGRHHVRAPPRARPTRRAGALRSASKSFSPKKLIMKTGSK